MCTLNRLLSFADVDLARQDKTVSGLHSFLTTGLRHSHRRTGSTANPMELEARRRSPTALLAELLSLKEYIQVRANKHKPRL